MREKKAFFFQGKSKEKAILIWSAIRDIWKTVGQKRENTETYDQELDVEVCNI